MTQPITATGLVRPGSRISHGLLVAGEAQAVSEFQDWLQPRLGAGQHLENLEAGRPEIQNTLARARQFLALVSLLSALIAAVAIGLGARRFAERHLDGFAILKARRRRQPAWALRFSGTAVSRKMATPLSNRNSSSTKR